MDNILQEDNTALLQESDSGGGTDTIYIEYGVYVVQNNMAPKSVSGNVISLTEPQRIV